MSPPDLAQPNPTLSPGRGIWALLASGTPHELPGAGWEVGTELSPTGQQEKVYGSRCCQLRSTDPSSRARDRFGGVPGALPVQAGGTRGAAGDGPCPCPAHPDPAAVPLLAGGVPPIPDLPCAAAPAGVSTRPLPPLLSPLSPARKRGPGTPPGTVPVPPPPIPGLPEGLAKILGERPGLPRIASGHARRAK